MGLTRYGGDPPRHPGGLRRGEIKRCPFKPFLSSTITIIVFRERCKILRNKLGLSCAKLSTA